MIEEKIAHLYAMKIFCEISNSISDPSFLELIDTLVKALANTVGMELSLTEEDKREGRMEMDDALKVQKLYQEFTQELFELTKDLEIEDD